MQSTNDESNFSNSDIQLLGKRIHSDKTTVPESRVKSTKIYDDKSISKENLKSY
jgi:hypothetical protein